MSDFDRFYEKISDIFALCKLSGAEDRVFVDIRMSDFVLIMAGNGVKMAGREQEERRAADGWILD
jgi:hypothetical protein